MSRIIELTNTRKAFEDVYQLSDLGNILRNKRIRKMLLVLLVITLSLAVSSYHSFKANNYVVLTVMLGISWLSTLIMILIPVIAIVKWKKSITASIDGIAKYQTNTIEISDKGFLLRRDNSEVFESWKYVISYQLESNFVFLTAKENYLFPKASMNEAEFEFLIDTIQKKTMA
ncbi:MAG: hypothetical protein WBP58_00060 [Chitinophagaceae bacterium]